MQIYLSKQHIFMYIHTLQIYTHAPLKSPKYLHIAKKFKAYFLLQSGIQTTYFSGLLGISFQTHPPYTGT